MNTTSSNRPLLSDSRNSAELSFRQKFKTPHFDNQTTEEGMRVIVYLPGIDAAGIEIRSQDTDLTVTARRQSVLRTNWRALHLENVQCDYLLNLRLGRNLDQVNLRASLQDGLLTIDIPKVAPRTSRSSESVLNQSPL